MISRRQENALVSEKKREREKNVRSLRNVFRCTEIVCDRVLTVILWSWCSWMTIHTRYPANLSVLLFYVLFCSHYSALLCSILFCSIRALSLLCSSLFYSVLLYSSREDVITSSLIREIFIPNWFFYSVVFCSILMIGPLFSLFNLNFYSHLSC